jgi:hypothetical protein
VAVRYILLVAALVAVRYILLVAALIPCITFNCTVHGAMSRGVLYRSRRYVTWCVVQFKALRHAEIYTFHGAMSRGVLYSSRRYVTRSVIQIMALSRGVLHSSRRCVTRSIVCRILLIVEINSVLL